MALVTPAGQAAGESLAVEQCEVKASCWLNESHQSREPRARGKGSGEHRGTRGWSHPAAQQRVSGEVGRHSNPTASRKALTRSKGDKPYLRAAKGTICVLDEVGGSGQSWLMTKPVAVTEMGFEDLFGPRKTMTSLWAILAAPQKQWLRHTELQGGID